MITLTANGYVNSQGLSYLESYRVYLDLIIDQILSLKDWDEVRVF